MSEFLMVVAGVSAPFLIGCFISHYFRYRAEVVRRSASSADDGSAAEAAELRREMQTLRERIEVLEAIVTDGRYDLDRKIANL